MSASEYLTTGVGDRKPVGLSASSRAMGVEAWTLLALVVIAALIRIITLDNQSLWADEALTAHEVRLPFGAMLSAVAHVETTPPLYFVLVWGWAKLFGTGAVAIRSLSALAGVALVPITFGATRELVSRRAGLLAAAFVACNPFVIWYSQEARSYALLAVLTGASFWCFARARRDPSASNLAWWAGLSAAALTTHFFAGFVAGPEALWLLWRTRTRATAVAVAVVAATQAAMLPFVLTAASPTYGTSWIARIALPHRIGETVIEWGASNLYRRITDPVGLLAGAALALAVVWLLVAGRGDPGARRGTRVAAVVAAVGFGAPLLLGVVGQDYFLSRNEIIAFVPVVTVLAAACTVPGRRVASAALAIVLLCVFTAATIDVQTHPYLQRANWRAAARALGPAVAPRAILAATGTAADPLEIYLPGVDWTQSPARRVPIAEIDVVGTRKRIAVLPAAGATGGPGPRGARVGRSPLPRSDAPPGTRLLTRLRVKNWTVARFALTHPQALSIDALRRLAPRFFRHTPVSLLVFTQPRGR